MDTDYTLSAELGAIVEIPDIGAIDVSSYLANPVLVWKGKPAGRTIGMRLNTFYKQKEWFGRFRIVNRELIRHLNEKEPIALSIGYVKHENKNELVEIMIVT